jgi:xanthine/uracil permease
MRQEPQIVVQEAYGDYVARRNFKWHSEGVLLGVLTMVAGVVGTIYFREYLSVIFIIIGFLIAYFSYKGRKRADESIGRGHRITYG